MTARPRVSRLPARPTTCASREKVQPLGHHLRPQQNICPPLGKLLQQRLVGGAALGGVCVHAQDPGRGKELHKLVLDALGAGADQADMLPSAHGAPAEHGDGCAAVVTHEPVVAAMVGEGGAAVFTHGDIAAVHAGRHPGGAPPVEKQNALLAPLQIVLQLLPEPGADPGGIPLLQLAPHIRQQRLRQRRVLKPAAQGEEMIHAGLGGIIAFHRRRCRAKDQQTALPGRPVAGHLPGMVAGVGLVGFIGIFLLLVHQNTAQRLHRGQNGGARPDDHPGLSLPDAAVFRIALGVGQPAVEDGHLPAEILPELLDHLGRQRDLRHQQDGAPAQLQRPLDQADIDPRLAAARNAVKQRSLRPLLFQKGLQTVAGQLLLLV